LAVDCLSDRSAPYTGSVLSFLLIVMLLAQNRTGIHQCFAQLCKYLLTTLVLSEGNLVLAGPVFLIQDTELLVKGLNDLMKISRHVLPH